MSVAVKMHRTERAPAFGRPGVILRFRPKTPARVIKHIEREYGDYLVDEGDELVVWEETDLAREIGSRMTPGTYLRHLREATSMTQKAVGEKVGVSTNYVSDWETGQRPVSRFKARALGHLFGVSAAVFI
jgi:DNA-binding transcriptional regulator YiaG